MSREGGKVLQLKRPAIDVADSEAQHSPNKIPAQNKNNSVFNFETPNRFEPLTSLMESDSNESESQPKSPLVPPIFIVMESSNFSDISKIISDACFNKSFTTKLIRNQLKVMLEDSEDYREVTKALALDNIEFHSFRNPNEKIFSVVLKDVPTSIPDSEIFNELKAQDFPMIKVARLFNKDRKSIPVVVVELEDCEKSQEILNLTKLFYSIIKVEVRHKVNKIAQCTRCQRKGHTKNYCHLIPRFVKCTDDPPHATKDCKKKDRLNPAKCINCKGEHPANYRGCSYLKTTFPKSDKRSTHRSNNHQNSQLPTTSIQPPISSPPPSFVQSSKSYAECAAGLPRQSPNVPSRSSRREEEPQNHDNSEDSLFNINLQLLEPSYQKSNSSSNQ